MSLSPLMSVLLLQHPSNGHGLAILLTRNLLTNHAKAVLGLLINLVLTNHAKAVLGLLINPALTNHAKVALDLLINLVLTNHAKAVLGLLTQVPAAAAAIDDPLPVRPPVTDKLLQGDRAPRILEHAHLADFALDLVHDQDSDDHLLYRNRRQGGLQGCLKNLERMKNPVLKTFAMRKEIKNQKFIVPSTHVISKVFAVEKTKFGVREKDVKCVPILPVKKSLSVQKTWPFVFRSQLRI